MFHGLDSHGPCGKSEPVMIPTYMWRKKAEAGVCCHFGADQRPVGPSCRRRRSRRRPEARLHRCRGVPGGALPRRPREPRKSLRGASRPSIGLWSARALAANGKLVEAAERYLEIGRLEPEGDMKVQKRAQQDAEKELAVLSKRLPSLTIGMRGTRG